MNNIPIGFKRTATLCILRNRDMFLLLKRAKEFNEDRFTPVGGKSEPFAFNAEYDEQINLLSMTKEIENIKII